MRVTLALPILCLVLWLSPSAQAASPDPCRDKARVESNAVEGRCYARERARVNAEADSLAVKLTSELRKAASAEDARDDAVNADLLRKTADALTSSQESWKAYRDQHCRAVEYSYTTGSGAGIAYESCMFDLGQRRLHELRVAFGDMDFSH